MYCGNSCFDFYDGDIKMNERIKELIKQATTIEEHKWGVSYDNFDKEKFAKLIVRECLAQVDKIRDSLEEDNEDQQALGADWAGLAIARHFGVEL